MTEGLPKQREAFAFLRCDRLRGRGWSGLCDRARRGTRPAVAKTRVEGRITKRPGGRGVSRASAAAGSSAGRSRSGRAGRRTCGSGRWIAPRVPALASIQRPWQRMTEAGMGLRFPTLRADSARRVGHPRFVLIAAVQTAGPLRLRSGQAFAPPYRIHVRLGPQSSGFSG